MIEHALWTEKYRPANIEDCVLPAKVKKIFSGIVRTKSVPHLILCGSAGVGKTTIAKALCSELNYDVLLINASEQRGIQTLRDSVITFAGTLSFEGKRKAIILDEADYLTPEMQAGLRSTMEKYSSNCSFILTCNFKDRLIKPIQSRCAIQEFRIGKEDKKEVLGLLMQRIVFILNNESIKYEPKALAAVVSKFFPDFRKIINHLQNYAQMEQEINEGILSFISDINVDKLCDALKDKKFVTVREWVVENVDVEPSRIYRKIYDAVLPNLTAESIPQAILIISDHLYKSSFSADQEITLVACLINLMIDCKFN